MDEAATREAVIAAFKEALRWLNNSLKGHRMTDTVDELEQYSETVRLDHNMAPKIFRPGEWVEIRLEMTAEDDILIKNKSAKITADAKAKKQKQADILLTVGDTNLMLVQRMVTGWHVKVNRFNVVNSTLELVDLPFSPQNARKLPKKVWDYVIAKINEFNPDMDEEEQQDFLTSASGRSEAS